MEVYNFVGLSWRGKIFLGIPPTQVLPTFAGIMFSSQLKWNFD